MCIRSTRRHGFVALLHLDYTPEQIAAKVGKNACVRARLGRRLAELAPAVVEAFAKDEIGVGHALLLAKLQPEQQEEALAACYQEAYTNGSKAKRILLPVRHLQQWIEHNILLELAAAPFSKEDAQLVPEAGSCVDCPKRTGHNTLLFAEIGADQPDRAPIQNATPRRSTRTSSRPSPQSRSWFRSAPLTASRRKAARHSRATSMSKSGRTSRQRKKQRDWPEYKTCKFTTEAIVTEGTEKGETKRVCANPECPVHHPKKQQQRDTRRCSIQGRTGEAPPRGGAWPRPPDLRVLKAIGEAVPVRLMKRDLLFVAERLTAMLDERRLSVLIRQHGIGKPKDGATPAKLLAAFLPKAEESKLGRILVETVILLSMHNQADAAKVLRDAAHVYKVDVDAISAKVKQEFAAKEKAKASEEGRAKTGSLSQRRRQRHSLQPTETIRGASNTGSAFSCPAARLPALTRCPRTRATTLARPTRTRALPSGHAVVSLRLMAQMRCSSSRRQ